MNTDAFMLSIIFAIFGIFSLIFSIALSKYFLIAISLLLIVFSVCILIYETE